MKRGVSGFRGERLSQALDVRRLTQVQLASMVEVSPPTISKWRSGQQNPDPDALERLAKVINVEPDWFLRPVADTGGSALLFRSNASAHVVARALLRARHNWSKELVQGLSEFVDFPDINFPCRVFHNPSEIADEDIESAAAECRKAWKLGLGPIADVVLAVENAGGIVVREITGISQIEGLSSWSSSCSRPFIYLCADKENGIRSRFDVAHELGHIILHRYVDEGLAKSMHNEMERQAHRFAGAFLMPAETFATEVPLVPSLDTLLALKPRWKVSVAAMLMRLSALELIDEKERLNLFKRKSSRFGSKAEPLDDRFEPERPRLIRRAITLLAESNIMPIEAIPRYFGLSKGDMEGLGGLPTGYFTPKQGIVINLESVRLRRA
jgi:Zn-dependent peptidase ImmA (M78 family)/transcriptional regulator with XRE-family HTH domain